MSPSDCGWAVIALALAVLGIPVFYLALYAARQRERRHARRTDQADREAVAVANSHSDWVEREHRQLLRGERRG